MNETAAEERMTTEERTAGGFSTIMIYILWLAGLTVLGRGKKKKSLLASTVRNTVEIPIVVRKQSK